MPQRSSDLEQERQSFISHLSDPKPEMNGYQDFITYWNRVDAESREVEDVGKLERWVQYISHDRDRLHALYDRMDTMKEMALQRDMIMQILRKVLDSVHSIEKRLRGRFNRRRAILLAILWRGGPGTHAKPKGWEEANNQKDPNKEGVDPILLAQGPGQAQQAKAPTQPQQAEKTRRM